MARKRNFVTRQRRITTKKFADICRHAYFLAKHIQRFVSFGLLDRASFLAKDLSKIINENPRLRKNHTTPTRAIEKLDDILLEKINPKILQKLKL